MRHIRHSIGPPQIVSVDAFAGSLPLRDVPKGLKVVTQVAKRDACDFWVAVLWFFCERCCANWTHESTNNVLHLRVRVWLGDSASQRLRTARSAPEGSEMLSGPV